MDAVGLFTRRVPDAGLGRVQLFLTVFMALVKYMIEAAHYNVNLGVGFGIDYAMVVRKSNLLFEHYALMFVGSIAWNMSPSRTFVASLVGALWTGCKALSEVAEDRLLEASMMTVVCICITWILATMNSFQRLSPRFSSVYHHSRTCKGRHARETCATK